MRSVPPPLRHRWAGLAVALLAGLVACSGSGSEDAAPTTPPDAPTSASPLADETTAPTTTGPDAPVFPGSRWDTADPADLGLDEAKLEEIAAKAEAAGSMCLLVARHGRIAAQWYWNGADEDTTQEVFSATKSFTSVLAGMAVADGVLDLDAPAADHIPAWQGTPAAAVTTRNLLRNDSGRYWDLATDYGQLVRSRDRSQFGIDLDQVHPPGEVWAYNNSAIQTLSEVLQDAFGQEPADYAEERLFAPIGMDDTVMTLDSAGNTLTFMGVSSTCGDMARLGLLMQRGGEWDGQQVVPAEWVAQSTGGPSTELTSAYGYLWWLNRPGRLVSPVQATTGRPGGDVAEGQLVPGAPEDMFWALGMGNQVIQVDPGSDTVVVRIGPVSVPAGAEPFTRADTARVVTEALLD